MISLIVLFLGLLSIFAEFYLPGMVMGVIGGFLIFTSIILFSIDNPSGLFILLYLIIVAILISALIKFALWSIRLTKNSHSLYSADNQSGFQASSFDQTLIGQTGVVLTDLKPGGHILIDNKRVQAISKTNYLTKGTEIVVIDGQEDSLIVIKYEKKETIHDSFN